MFGRMEAFLYQRSLVVGKFAPLHRGHQLVIEMARARSHSVTVLVYATPDFIHMPNEMRAGWIRAIYPDVDCRVPDHPPLDRASDLVHRRFVTRFLAAEGIVVDAVFSSESYGPGFAEMLGVDHIMVDRLRTVAPVSGSAIRSSSEFDGEWLHPVVGAAIGDVRDLDRRG